MDAMVMPFTVREAKTSRPRARHDDRVHAGGEPEVSYVEDVRIPQFDSTEREPVDARRLKLLEDLIDPKSRRRRFGCGQPVPNFILTDQNQRRISLGQLSGKVVALNFVYTRCACLNIGIGLSITLAVSRSVSRTPGAKIWFSSPSHSTLSTTTGNPGNYAKTWKADPNNWHFLTGGVPDVERVCNLFGVGFWPDEAQLTHSLHTAVIDRQGKLVANLERESIHCRTARYLVETVISRSIGGPKATLIA